MISVGVTSIDVKDILDGIKAVEKRDKNLRPVWKKIRPLFRADLKDHFKQKEGPDGKWKGPSRATLEKVRRQKGSVYRRGKRAGQFTKRGQKRLLRAGPGLGRLKTAFGMKTSRGGIVATSKVKWSGVHQDGGIVGNGARIPKRTFAWISNDFAAEVEADILDYVIGAW